MVIPSSLILVTSAFNKPLPKEIIVPEFIDSNLLSEYFNTKVETRVKGDRKKLLDLAYSSSLHGRIYHFINSSSNNDL